MCSSLDMQSFQQQSASTVSHRNSFVITVNELGHERGFFDPEPV